MVGIIKAVRCNILYHKSSFSFEAGALPVPKLRPLPKKEHTYGHALFF